MEQAKRLLIYYNLLTQMRVKGGNDYIDYVDMVNGIVHMKNGTEAEIGVTYKSKIKEALHG